MNSNTLLYYNRVVPMSRSLLQMMEYLCCRLLKAGSRLVDEKGFEPSASSLRTGNH